MLPRSEAFAKQGHAPIRLDAHRAVNFDGFLGTLYFENGCDEKLLPEETIEAFYPVSDGVTLTVTDADDNTTDCPIVADVSELHSLAKYRTFSGGNNPFSVVTNPNIKDDSVLILVKESFGNPLPLRSFATIIQQFTLLTIAAGTAISSILHGKFMPMICFLQTISMR